jgi:pimeloyl-ACP methyl ester carboxylesterase
MFTYEDININYEYIDNKKENTLVFLHGWGQNIQMMLPIANSFTKDNNVLVIDLPGHGKTKEPTYAWDLDKFVDMLHELLKYLKITNPILIGHSFGGKLAIIYASKYKVKKLVLLSSPYRGEYKKPPFKVRMLKKLAKVPGLKSMANYFKKHMGSTDYKNASPLMRDILVKHVNTDTTENCKKINVPTIIIWGTNDTTVSIDNAYEIEKLIKDSAVIPYEGMTHFAYLEDKQKTINIINSFIG